MTAFTWSSDLETGDSVIDEQHMKLHALFGKLLDAEDSPENVRRVLDELSEYTLVHFAMEEDLMRRAGYPDDAFEAHVAEHRAFLDETRTQILHCQLEGPPSVTSLATFLHDWLADHVHESDRALVEFVQRNPDAGFRDTEAD